MRKQKSCVREYQWATVLILHTSSKTIATQFVLNRCWCWFHGQYDAYLLVMVIFLDFLLSFLKSLLYLLSVVGRGIMPPIPYQHFQHIPAIATLWTFADNTTLTAVTTVIFCQSAYVLWYLCIYLFIYHKQINKWNKKRPIVILPKK